MTANAIALINNIRREFDELNWRKSNDHALDVKQMEERLDKLTDLFGSLLAVIEEMPAKLQRLEERHDRPGDFVKGIGT